MCDNFEARGQGGEAFPFLAFSDSYYSNKSQGQPHFKRFSQDDHFRGESEPLYFSTTWSWASLSIAHSWWQGVPYKPGDSFNF
ncbi:MAG: hypothetical protein NT004_09220 [Bacteroidetes bacterium]|nr:hypothetical protein [Bacteroidota bacterium]